MGLSCQHNSMWVTFICKTFHCMKMFYLISKNSIISCPWQSIVHHQVQRVISYEINQGGRRQNKIPDLGVTRHASGSAEPAFQDPGKDFVGHSWVSRSAGREAAIHLLHGLRLDAAAAQGGSRGPRETEGFLISQSQNIPPGSSHDSFERKCLSTRASFWLGRKWLLLPLRDKKESLCLHLCQLIYRP